MLTETLERRCAKCGETKSLDAFHANKRESRKSWCKDCYSEYAMLRNYGITPERYAELLFLQNGVCAICKTIAKPGKRLWIDHDHVTGIVRGLLCPPCNMAIGIFKDNPDLLRAAISYLGEVHV